MKPLIYTRVSAHITDTPEQHASISVLNQKSTVTDIIKSRKKYSNSKSPFKDTHACSAQTVSFFYLVTTSYAVVRSVKVYHISLFGKQ